MSAKFLRQLGVLIVIAFGLPCAAQEDILRGPQVPEGAGRTMVRQSMSGGFERVEGRPEAAAALLVVEGAERRRQLESVVHEHAFRVAMLLVEQIETVRAMSDAVMAEDAEKARALLADLWGQIDAERKRDLLMPELSRILTPEERVEVQRLLDEYWQAWTSWEMRSQRGLTGEELREARRKTQERLMLQLFQEEVRIGYELTLRRYRQALDAMYEAVDPTPEQREAMRTVVIEHIRATRLEATPEQRRAATHAIYRLLDEERRAKLFDYMLRQLVPD